MVDDNFKKARPMRYLPIAVDVKDKHIVVFGGGKVAFGKLKTIALFASHVTVVSAKILPEIKALPVRCIQASYDKKFLEGASLVYACTSQRKVNHTISHDARKKGILCNVADDINACAFISPAVMVKNNLVLAINSQGLSPGTSKKARDFIKDKIDEFTKT